MGNNCLLLQIFVLSIISFSFICGVNAANVPIEGTIHITREIPIAVVNENFICASLDLWPPEKCDFGTCSWANSSFLNVDLNNKILKNAVKEFSPLMMRLGGTLQDNLIYQEDSEQPCDPTFRLDTSQLGYSQACLPLARWDELHSFIKETKAQVIFGLNALNGKTIQTDNIATGVWDNSNAKSFIEYTLKKNYKIHGWELGNELGGRQLNVGVHPGPYANDTSELHNSTQQIYRASNSKPLIMGPAAILDNTWYKQYIHKTRGFLDVVTHHLYTVGGGSEASDVLVEKILNATVLDSSIEYFKNLSKILIDSGTETVAWVDESGGIFGSGRNGVSNAFIFSFWYLDILGQASVYDTKTFCRQTLVGGNYGLLSTTTFVPNPDYYSALLWHRLMGRNVLSTRFVGSKNIRAYAHCAKKSTGITILMINLDGNATVEASLDFEEAYGTTREEYRLTAMDGNLQSRTMLLNGKPLVLDSSGAIPALEPVLKVNSSGPITVDPHSILFVHFPQANAPGCRLIGGN